MKCRVCGGKIKHRIHWLKDCSTECSSYGNGKSMLEKVLEAWK